LNHYLRNTLAAGLLMAAAAGQGAAAQQAATSWTATQPIRIVVPFSAGGGSDVAARLVSAGMGNALGQPMVVENKPGASGAIASDIVYTAAPDGHTLLLGTADTQAMNPHVNKVRFDALKYVPVGGIAKVPYVLVGRPDLPAANLAELLALAKRTSLSYGSSGAGTGAHVQMTMFAKAANVTDLLHVPYQGVAPAFQAVLAGQVDLSMVPVALASQYPGKLRFYGLPSLDRNPALPDVPTLAEQGYRVDADSWNGLLAPPGTPPEVAAAIAQKLLAVVSAPEAQKKLRELGMVPYTDPQAEFAEFYKKEYDKWGAAIQAAGLAPGQGQ